MSRQFSIKDLNIKVNKTTYGKHPTLHVYIRLKKSMRPIYYLQFKKFGGYKSYSWARYGNPPKYYCGRKNMVRDFISDFKKEFLN